MLRWRQRREGCISKQKTTKDHQMTTGSQDGVPEQILPPGLRKDQLHQHLDLRLLDSRSERQGAHLI